MLPQADLAHGFWRGRSNGSPATWSPGVPRWWAPMPRARSARRS